MRKITPKKIGFASAMDALRKELRLMAKTSTDECFLAVDEVVLEAEFCFEASGEGSGGVNIYFWNAGAKASVKKANTHKISIKFKSLVDYQNLSRSPEEALPEGFVAGDIDEIQTRQTKKKTNITKKK